MSQRDLNLLGFMSIMTQTGLPQPLTGEPLVNFLFTFYFFQTN